MDRTRIVIATGNRGKIREIVALYGDLPIDWLPMGDLGAPPTIVEDGATFQENALLKARTIGEWSRLPVLADDSGLEVDALAGAPGVHTARFAGSNAIDAENIALLLRRLDGIPAERRSARFRAYAVVCWPDGTYDGADGTCEGRIAEAPRGASGFGYDPVFVPAGHERTFAELGPGAKNRMSHRAVALAALRPFIERKIAPPSARNR